MGRTATVTNSDTGAAAASRVPFDTGAGSAGPSSTSVVDARGIRDDEPVVAPERRTPTIVALEAKRDEAKTERISLTRKLDELKTVPATPDRDVKIAEVEQKISAAESKVIFYNFRIGEELEKPPAAGTPK